MTPEEERSQRPEFRVVDKRISARGDTAPPKKERAAPAQPPRAEEPPAQAGTTDGAPADPSLTSKAQEPIWTPEQEAEAQRFVQEIAQRSSLDWVLNTAVTLANVAGTKLDLGDTTDAQLAIDALAALVEKLGSRFGQAEGPLRQTLAQLQLAYAQRTMPPAPGPQA